MDVSSFSQLLISSIILVDSPETSIIVEVRFSCAFDTSEAIFAVDCADALICSTASEIEVLICSTIATFVSSVRSIVLM